MPYVFVDDGYPESAEFDNNYVWFDPADPACRESLRRLLPPERADAVLAAAEAAQPAPAKSNRWKFWR